MARKTKQDAQKTRDAILDCAVRIFAEKGVAATSLREIAAAADVTRGAIYWHFNNKTEIFDALHNRLYQPVTEMILEDLEKDHPAPLEQMKDLCLRFLLDLENNEQKRQALNLFLFKCDYSGDLAAYKKQHEARQTENLRLFSRYFEKARDKNSLSPSADPEILTLSTHCYMKGILLEYLNDPAKFNIKDKAPKLIGLFFENNALSH